MTSNQSAKRFPLSTRLIAILSILSAIQVGVIGWMAWQTLHNSVTDQIGLRALSVAKTFAHMPDVIDAVVFRDLKTLQALAHNIQQKNQALFVVVGDHDGIRLAHPNPDKIGHSMADDDGDTAELALLHGGSYIDELPGSLGLSIRGKTAILNAEGQVAGVVSVGYASSTLTDIVGRYSLWLFALIMLALFASIGAAIFIAYRLKGELFGLEPIQIASLFKEREATLESVREGIIAVDAKGRITTFNRQALSLLDIREQESVLGMSIEKVLPESKLMDVLSSGKADFDQEVWFNGRQMIVNRVPFKQGRNIVGGVSSFRAREDIDLISKKLTRIEQYAESLQSQAHEYNNKLHTISGLIQIGEADKALSLIGAEVADHQHIIRLVLRRINDPIVAGCMLGKYNRARELGIKLELDEASHFEGVPESITPDQFVAILGNLLDNAFEATRMCHDSDGVVQVSFSDYGNDFVLEVEDHGVGIPEASRSRVFERGFSSKDGDTRGIGLHLIQTIISQVSGSIEIEQAEPRGTRFVVYLPKRLQRRETPNE